VKAKEGVKLELGSTSLPDLPKDLTDRNRTSPFAFTGNKFEFRMAPAGDSISGPNVVLNTAVAEILSQFADRLEKAGDKQTEVKKIISESYKAHRKVVFNGNGYSEEWQTEAGKRGLPNVKSWVEAIPELASPKSEALFGKHKVFSKEELHSRVEIYFEKYAKTINIEAGVMIEMAKKNILPSALDWLAGLSATLDALNAAKVPTAGAAKQLKEGGELVNRAYIALEALEVKLAKTRAIEEIHAKAVAFRKEVFVVMSEVRHEIDALEKILPADYYPYPTYEDMLFRF
jgi:glutamine synthetase